MDNQQTFQISDLIKRLADLGKSDDDIEKIILEFNNLISSKFYIEAMSKIFTEEEISNINEQANSQEEANKLIDELYFEKVGVTSEETKSTIAKDLISAYLKDLN